MVVLATKKVRGERWRSSGPTMGGAVNGGAMKTGDLVTGSRVSPVEALLVPWRLVDDHFRGDRG